jgi:hypothetical protein
VQRDHFTRTIRACDPATTHEAREFKAILDAGCDAGDVISLQVVSDLLLWDKVQLCDKVIGVCLHGHELKSVGTIVLRWEGKGFYKIFETRFHVIQGDSLPWQVILGAATCAEHHLLTAGAYGGRRQILPARPKGEPVQVQVSIVKPRLILLAERAEHAIRKAEFEKEAAANMVRVNDDKKKKQAARIQSSTSLANSSTSSSQTKV